MEVEKWEVGAAFLPASLGYLLGTGVLGGLAGLSRPRWMTAQTGLRVVGVSLAMVSEDNMRRRRRGNLLARQVSHSLHLAVM